MTPSSEAVFNRLLEHRVLGPRDVVDGGVEVSESARRNLNLRIDRGQGQSLFVKLADPGLPEARVSLATEARFYQFCQDEPRTSKLQPALARARLLLPDDPLVALDMVEGTRPLWEEYRAHAPDRFPATTAGTIGQALGTLHAVFRQPGLASDPRLGPLRDLPPPYFALRRPQPARLRYITQGQLQLLGLAQSDPAILDGMGRAEEDWRVETLIHGDVRSDNVLVAAGGRATPRVKLVDWEFIQRGDPAWDVAGVLQDFILFWIAGMSLAPELDSAARTASATWPLDALQPAIGLFWSGYLESSGQAGASSRELLLRSVVYSACRLIQTAFESLDHSERCSVPGLLLLQISSNIFADAERSSRELFGLGVEDSAGLPD